MRHLTYFLYPGLNVGPVIAGVVGAQKPLYDIWSNTVNVASRMDNTGVEGKIQVPEEAAKYLKEQNVSCTYRDKIFVKGKGEMKVYYVDLDDELMLMSIDKERGAEELEEDRYITTKLYIYNFYKLITYRN